MYTREIFKNISSIVANLALTATPTPQTFNGSITLNVLSGNVWIDPTQTASSTTGLKLLSGNVIDLRVKGTLSLISDATGATVQIIVWED